MFCLCFSNFVGCDFLRHYFIKLKNYHLFFQHKNTGIEGDKVEITVSIYFQDMNEYKVLVSLGKSIEL